MTTHARSDLTRQIEQIQEHIYDAERARENAQVLYDQLAHLKEAQAQQQEQAETHAQERQALSESGGHAGEHVQAALRSDPEWCAGLESNIAMVIFDAGASLHLAEQAACRIMKRCFGVESVTDEIPVWGAPNGNGTACREMTLSERVWYTVESLPDEPGNVLSLDVEAFLSSAHADYD
jgi:hypothetical protein